MSVISAVTHTRRLYFQLKPATRPSSSARPHCRKMGRPRTRTRREGFIKSRDVTRFIRHLLRHIRGKITLILDNNAQHHTTEVKKLQQQFPRLHLEFLPGYSPDFNPDEGVWDHTKSVDLANFTPADENELTMEVRRSLRRLQRRPHKIADFWRQSELTLDGLEEFLLRD